MTKPSRSRSNGRLARCGSSLRVDIALMTVNAPKTSGESGASTPPASAARTSPRAMARNASPIATVPDAHEFPLATVGPREAELDRNVARRRAAEHRDRKQRSDGRQPALAKHVVLFVGEGEPAERRTEVDADVLAALARESRASSIARRLAAIANCENRSVQRNRLLP